MIHRENGKAGVLFKTPEYPEVPPLEWILKSEYDYIWEALISEHCFSVDDYVPMVFKEILYENRVVGFSSYDIGGESAELYILKYIYVLPEYRGNNLLVDDLVDTVENFKSVGLKFVGVHMPNKFVVKSLVRNGLASKFTSHLVVSRIPLCIEIGKKDDLTGLELEYMESVNFDIDAMESSMVMTFLYDCDLCATVSPDFKLISGICDADLKDDVGVLRRRIIDPNIYFSELTEEVKKAFVPIDEGSDI